jgi:MoaA/NifB/PqqE/SkfB family radical SAM enzyme
MNNPDTKQNNFDEHSFCPEVYNQIQIDMQGDLRVCCLSSDGGLLKDADGHIMNVATHSIIAAMNSDVHKQHRLELSQNTRPKRCSHCYNWENHNNNSQITNDSRRTKFIKFSKNTLPDYAKVVDAYKITSDDGSIDVTQTKLLNLDIRFGNLCNLKCVMCDPGNSSLWADDWDLLSRSFDDYNEFGQSQKFKQGGVDPETGNAQYWKSDQKVYLLEKNSSGKLKLSNQNWWETDSWQQQFKDIAPQLRYIYFTGGEPLIVPAMEQHLDYLIEQGFSKNIRLSYDTNLTAINQNIIDKWKKFKFVELRISVDETGDRYHLVRNPGNFVKLQENIKKIKQSGIDVQRISIVCSMANIYGPIRIAKFAKEIDVPASIRFVTRPGWLNIQHLPTSARKEIIENLNNFLQSEEKNTVAGFEYIIHSQITHLTGTLSSPGLLHMTETFVHSMNVLDRARNLNWKNIIPDVADLIRRHCPSIDLDKSV